MAGGSLKKREAGQADGGKSTTKAGREVHGCSKEESEVDSRLTHSRGWA